MSTVGTKGTWVAALVLSAGLLGSAGIVARAAPVAQATPPSQSTASSDRCQADDADQEDEGDVGDQDEAGDRDNVQDENGADDEAEGDTEDEAADDENGEEGSGGAEDEGAATKLGELSEGQDLLPKATISIEEAVRAAQAETTGTLGSVELEEKDGTLVFEVTVGEQEVFVDAADGSIVATEPVPQNGGDCEDEGGATPAATATA